MGIGLDSARDLAKTAFLKGVEAADPGLALARALSANPIEGDGPITIVAVGKAARKMAEAAMPVLGARIASTLVVTNYENEGNLPGAQVFGAAHPVPDENGLAAGQEVIQALAKAGAGDRILALISGGASALLPAPVEGVSLADKQKTNEVLLSSGFEITEMNLVRQSLSKLKGGGMLRLAAPAPVRSFILSAVLGDDLRVIGSGPSVGAIGPVSEALALLTERGVLGQLPVAAQNALARADDPEAPAAEATLIGSNAMSLSAMAEAATATISEPDLIGDVRDAAERIVHEAKAGQNVAFGGETTVTLTGSGRGGRNQELALHVAKVAAEQNLVGPWVFLSGGTDGRDGPTDAAGAIVDHGTLSRIAAAGLSIDEILDDNDSYKALEASGDLLMTGGTGTNVADLQLFLPL